MFKLVYTFIITFSVHGLRWIQSCPIFFKLAKTCSNWSGLVQTGPNWSNLVWLVQIGPNWSKLVQIGTSKLLLFIYFQFLGWDGNPFNWPFSNFSVDFICQTSVYLTIFTTSGWISGRVHSWFEFQLFSPCQKTAESFF